MYHFSLHFDRNDHFSNEIISELVGAQWYFVIVFVSFQTDENRNILFKSFCKRQKN